MAKACAIFTYLLMACSEFHELSNQEASHCNCGACLSVAGDKAEFGVPHLPMLKSKKQLLTGAKHCHTDIIMYLPESQDIFSSGGMVLTGTQAQMASPHGYRQPCVLDFRRIRHSALVPHPLFVSLFLKSVTL
jgi:hypothetical protein